MAKNKYPSFWAAQERKGGDKFDSPDFRQHKEAHPEKNKTNSLNSKEYFTL